MLKNKKIYLTLLTVVIAMLSITQLFGSSKENNNFPYMPRQINLSGNIVNFSIPENFSTDFPADDLKDVEDNTLKPKELANTDEDEKCEEEKASYHVGSKQIVYSLPPTVEKIEQP